MIKTGIFFGGPSREREISFAGGRTVYDNLDKSLFEPIPIFVDSWGNFILLDWQYLYKGSIRDFFPPAQFLPTDNWNIQLYAECLHNLSEEEQTKLTNSIGQKLSIEDLPNHIDFAFLALHGAKGEDGSIQGLLEYLNIPYSGSGLLPSAIGMNKVFQKDCLKGKSYSGTKFKSIFRNDWLNGNQSKIFQAIKEAVPIPFVTRPANQGSSIGVGMMMEENFALFQEQVNRAFFIEVLQKSKWQALNEQDQIEWLKEISDIRSSIGLPLKAVWDQTHKIASLGEGTPTTKTVVEKQEAVFYQPKDLLIFLEQTFQTGCESIQLEAVHSENEVLIESFIDGREFSCIVVRSESGEAKALPPTEIIKGQEIYDYRSKYLPGMSRKQTPIDLPNEEIERIRKSCTELFEFFRFDVYARIDGFYQADGNIVLNDPNTTSGMLPSSFFFHQAAEIGLNPSQFLTFLIRQSLSERLKSNPTNAKWANLLNGLDESIGQQKSGEQNQTKVAVIMGGYSSERHISVESGRNIYEKLASTSNYQAIPFFLTGKQNDWNLYQIPVNLMLKDNADDIREKLEKSLPDNPLLLKIREECLPITEKYTNGPIIYQAQKTEVEQLAQLVDFVFIGLHGRPGEDGELQEKLETVGLPYNGSPVRSSQITIDKYKTNQLLYRHGFPIAGQLLVRKEKWEQNAQQLYTDIALQFPYPFIVKPVDDGCSSAVKVIQNEEQLAVYSKMLFRESGDISEEAINILKLKPKEEMPIKVQYLVETFTQQKDSKHFLEVTGGLLTKRNEKGELVYEMFEASETLSSDAILSLEEKFLAGEGQNITPARYAKDPKIRQAISDKVKETLFKAAKILDIQGYARIDAFVRIYEEEIEVIIIEVNSLPGMTPATAIFHQAALSAYKPYEFIDKIIQFGMGK